MGTASVPMVIITVLRITQLWTQSATTADAIYTPLLVTGSLLSMLPKLWKRVLKDMSAQTGRVFQVIR